MHARCLCFKEEDSTFLVQIESYSPRNRKFQPSNAGVAHHNTWSEARTMAPNLKKISVLTLEDLPEFQLLGGRTKVDVPPADKDVSAITSASYWEWTSPTPSSSSSSVQQDFEEDLFSVEHIQSNLIQASQSFSKDPPVLSPNPASPEYWADREETTSTEEPLSHQPLHHCLVDLAASDTYWKDSHELSESDLYWLEGSMAAPDIQVAPKPRVVPQSAPNATVQDGPTTTAPPASLYRNATPQQQREESHRYWYWGHSETDSDRYWRFDGTPAMISAV